MKASIKFFLLFAIILFFFTTCDVFNAPLKEYIENATSKAAAGDWLITTQYHEMANGVIAIPPSEEAEYTKIIFDIDNPKNGRIKLEMEGAGAEFASVNLNNNGQASITIKNQKRGFVFDLSLKVLINGRHMTPKKLPKIENRYFNSELISVDVLKPGGSGALYDVFYNSYENNYWVELVSGSNVVNIKANLKPGLFSKYTINGTSNNIINLPNADNEIKIPIVVTADCGITGIYNLLAYRYGYGPTVTVTSNGKTTNHKTLESAYSSIGDSDKVIEIKVYKNIPILQNEDLFNKIATSPKQISLSSDVDVNISIGREGSMFTINKNITFILGGGKGILTLLGYNGNDSSLIYVNEGIFELYDGAIISENKHTSGMALYGSGVCVTNGGTFNMNGGRIKNNSAALTSDRGGGVYVTDSIFNMNGGSIEGNDSGSGGGVCIETNSTFRMSGGSIEKNNSPNGYGGGVHIRTNCIFEMSGGSIFENNSPNGYGGGVYLVLYGTFKMSGGSIIGNIGSIRYGGGVCIASNGTFEMSGGNIEGNKNDEGGGVYVGSNSTFEMSGGSIKGNSGTNGGGVDIRFNGKFKMSGGSIDGNNAIIIGGAVCIFETDGTFEMSGGSIERNSSANGGGVYIRLKSLFEMSGGSIEGNIAANNGGGVYVESDCTFGMSGGSIDVNKAANYGGGVYNDGNFIFIQNSGNHGIIKNNEAVLGGGVYNNNTYVGPPGTYTEYFENNIPQNIFQ